MVLALSYKSVRICAGYLAYVLYNSTVVKYISIYIHQHIHIHTYIFADENTEIQIANKEFTSLALEQNLLGRKVYNVLMYAVAISILGI